MRVSAAAAVLVAVMVLGASASASTGRSHDDVYVYTPASLANAAVGVKYDVTISVTVNGQSADLVSARTLTSSATIAPGVAIKQVKVNGWGALELVGTPTKPGTFPLDTCVLFQTPDCRDPRTWTFTVTGKEICDGELGDIAHFSGPEAVDFVRSTIIGLQSAETKVVDLYRNAVAETPHGQPPSLKKVGVLVGILDFHLTSGIDCLDKHEVAERAGGLALVHDIEQLHSRWRKSDAAISESGTKLRASLAKKDLTQARLLVSAIERIDEGAQRQKAAALHDVQLLPPFPTP